MSRKETWYDFNGLLLLRLVFLPYHIIIENVPHVLKNVYSAAVGWDVLQMPVRSIRSNV